MNIFDKTLLKVKHWKVSIANIWHRQLSKVWPSMYLNETQKSRIFPLGYGFPDELFSNPLSEKKHVWAEVIPGYKETYRFKDPEEYYNSYRDSRFAFTWKKGGWDCLRHYEIIANCCFPVFRDLADCPSNTLRHFPKKLILEGMQKLLPWRDTPDHVQLFEKQIRQLGEFAKENLSCSGIAKEVCQVMGIPNGAKVLFLTCDPRVNYSREFLFIGLNRRMKESGGICMSYPKIDFVYDSFPEAEALKLYGMGFGYSRRVTESHPLEMENFDSEWIKQSILKKDWDFVLYGKVGKDEWKQGSIPNLPFWKEVQKSFPKSKIGFLYGGDAMQNLKDMGSPHARHLAKHANSGFCFVRELDR